MTGFPTANFSDSERGLFTPAEIQRLMRIEFVRAVRYEYPIALLLIEVDRLEYLHDLYGYESREEILHSLVALLRSVTRASDFVGCMMDNRVMALFPHTPKKAAAALAGRLLRGSRGMQFESDGRSLRATISIGISTFDREGELDYPGFVGAAEEALRFAVDGGGDRFAQREPATAIFDELREELEAEARALQEEHDRSRERMPLASDAPLAPAPLPVRPLPPLEDLPQGSVGQRIAALFEAVGELPPELDELRDRVVELAQTSVDQALAQVAQAQRTPGAAHEQKVELLERRVTKLKELLDTTESELVRIARMKGVDTGVASIYRSVQGLSLGEDEYERKKEMLSLLFEANIELRKKIGEQP